MIILLLIIDAIITVVPAILTGIYYPYMPDKIPLFVNLMGEPVMQADKTIFTAFRLPVMTLILQAICLVFFLGCRKNTAEKPETAVLFRNFWIVLSITAAIKMGFSTIPITGIIPGNLMPLFRITAVGAAILGVIYLLICLAQMYKENKAGLLKIFTPAGNVYNVLIIALLLAYAAVVFLPRFTAGHEKNNDKRSAFAAIFGIPNSKWFLK
jgi:uncharacterized membrane protein